MKRATTFAVALQFFVLAFSASAKMPEGEFDITIGETPNIRLFSGFNEGLPHQQFYHKAWATIFLESWEFTKDGTDPREYALEIVGHKHTAASFSRGLSTTLFVTTTLSTIDFFGPINQNFNNLGPDAKVVFNGQVTALLTADPGDLPFVYEKKDAFYYDPWTSDLLKQDVARLVGGTGGEYLVGASAAVKSLYYTVGTSTVQSDNTGLNTIFRVRVVKKKGK